MQMSTEVLVWMTVGIALLSSEAFTGTFHLLFFGLSALFVAALTLLGLNSTVLQLVLFAVLSVSSVFLVRKRLIIRSIGFEGDRESVFTLDQEILPDQEVTISYQGAPWTAKNISQKTLPKGTRARVLRTDGIKLLLEGEN
jgi:membrane protein implicated in regulation of membrane protease activity